MLKYDPTTLILYQMIAAVNVLAVLALSLLLALRSLCTPTIHNTPTFLYTLQVRVLDGTFCQNRVLRSLIDLLIKALHINELADSHSLSYKWYILRRVNMSVEVSVFLAVGLQRVKCWYQGYNKLQSAFYLKRKAKPVWLMLKIQSTFIMLST